MKSNLDKWKEEYDELCKIQLIDGVSKKLARRLLVFTEGFLLKTSSLDKDKLSEEELNLLSRMILKAGVMKENG